MKVINLIGINIFLINTRVGFILIDTAIPSKLKKLEKALKKEGCKPGNLKLIILTHGDIDHAGNSAYLRNKYGAKIALHNDDWDMVETGDMNSNRKPKPDKFDFTFRILSIIGTVMPTGKYKCFTPDLSIDEDFNLAEYGFNAKILHLPGHSKGSIGILTKNGVLFCGDFVYNLIRRPGCYYIDDMSDFNASVKKLRKYNIRIIYPSHGKSFKIEAFFNTINKK